MIDDWVSFAISGVSGVSAIVCLFEGARRIGAQGARRGPVLMVALGGLFCAVWGGLAYWEHWTRLESSEALRRTAATAKLPPVLAKGVPAETREKLGLAYARAKYLEGGTLVTYADRSGKDRVFAPSQTDLKRREAGIVKRVQLDHASRDSFADAFLWWLWGFLAMLLGFFFSGGKRPAPESPR